MDANGRLTQMSDFLIAQLGTSDTVDTVESQIFDASQAGQISMFNEEPSGRIVVKTADADYILLTYVSPNHNRNLLQSVAAVQKASKNGGRPQYVLPILYKYRNDLMDAKTHGDFFLRVYDAQETFRLPHHLCEGDNLAQGFSGIPTRKMHTAHLTSGLEGRLIPALFNNLVTYYQPPIKTLKEGIRIFERQFVYDSLHHRSFIDVHILKEMEAGSASFQLRPLTHNRYGSQILSDIQDSVQPRGVIPWRDLSPTDLPLGEVVLLTDCSGDHAEYNPFIVKYSDFLSHMSARSRNNKHLDLILGEHLERIGIYTADICIPGDEIPPGSDIEVFAKNHPYSISLNRLRKSSEYASQLEPSWNVPRPLRGDSVSKRLTYRPVAQFMTEGDKHVVTVMSDDTNLFYQCSCQPFYRSTGNASECAYAESALQEIQKVRTELKLTNVELSQIADQIPLQ